MVQIDCYNLGEFMWELENESKAKQMIFLEQDAEEQLHLYDKNTRIGELE